MYTRVSVYCSYITCVNWLIYKHIYYLYIHRLTHGHICIISLLADDPHVGPWPSRILSSTWWSSSLEMGTCRNVCGCPASRQLHWISCIPLHPASPGPTKPMQWTWTLVRGFRPLVLIISDPLFMFYLFTPHAPCQIGARKYLWEFMLIGGCKHACVNQWSNMCSHHIGFTNLSFILKATQIPNFQG